MVSFEFVSGGKVGVSMSQVGSGEFKFKGRMWLVGIKWRLFLRRMPLPLSTRYERGILLVGLLIIVAGADQPFSLSNFIRTGSLILKLGRFLTP